MPKKKLQKSLQEYLSKIKSKPTPHIHNPKNFILSGCKHPKTQSFAVDQTRNNENVDAANKGDEAALADIDRFLFENFSSLYLRDDLDTASRNDNVRDKKGKRSNNVASDNKEPSYAGAVLFDSPRFLEPPRGLCGSARFFVGPGSSSSLVEEARSSTTSTAAGTTTTTNTTGGPSFTESIADNDSMAESQKEVRLPDDCIAVLAHSSSPYEDFRRSMREMMDARMRSRSRVDWEFMEELLFCYLNLNEKKSHKYILNAFVDLIVALRRSRDSAPPARHREAAAGRVARESRRRKPRREIL